MFLKLMQFFLVVFSYITCFSTNVYSNTLSPQNFNALYNLAAKGDLATIHYAISRGLNIDSVNSNGDTGLCVAAKRRHKKAFRSFLSSGANSSHYCTWGISGYREFYRETVVNPIKNLDEAKKYVEKTPMTMKTKTLIGAGIAVAGAGVAIGLSGGGGGGSDTDPNCVYGSWADGVCVCKEGYAGEKCNTCDTAGGYNNYGAKTCHKALNCGSYGEQKGGKCVCNTGYAGELCTDCALGYGRTDRAPECVRKAKEDIYGTSNNSNYNVSGRISVRSEDYKSVPGYKDIYGMFYDSDKTPHSYVLDKANFANTYLGVDTTTVTHEVIVIVEEEGEEKEEIEEEDVDYLKINKSASISVNNVGDGMAVGLYSNNADKIYNNFLQIKGSGYITGEVPLPTQPPLTITDGRSDASLTVVNVGDGLVYGIYGKKEIYSGDFSESGAMDGNATMTSAIIVHNTGSGNTYGIYNPSENGKIYNISKSGQYINLTSTLKVTNNGTGNAYGMYGLGELENSAKINSVANSGDAYGIYTKKGKIKNDNTDNVVPNEFAVDVYSSTGNSYGMYVEGGEVENGLKVSSRTISGTGDAYGIYAKNKSTVKNTSGITASSYGGNAYGIYNEGGKVVNSTQRYEIIVEAKNGYAYGIYSKGGEVENSGRITVYGENDSKSFGIYATNGAKITNYGDFWFNVNGTIFNPEMAEDYCNSHGCLTTGGAYAIYLTDGAKFVNKGNVESTDGLVLSNGTMLGQNGQFTASSLSGSLEVEADVVAAGFENSYTVAGAINSDNVSGLKLSSESALFDVAFQGADVVLTKKDFSEVVHNATVADFLEKNYALENNEKLFKYVKSQSGVKELNSFVDSLTGKELFARFAEEDLMTQNEINFDINENLFKIKDNTFSLSSEVSSYVYDNNGSVGRYALSGKQLGKARMAVGFAISDIKSDNIGNEERNSRDFQFFMPFQWNNNGFNNIITPKLAYSTGTYSRNGFNGQDYDGKIERQMMGVSAQTRQSAKFLGFDFNPTYEANLSAYKTQIKEDAKQFSLTSEDSTSYSATLGFGAYMSKQYDYSKNHKFNFMMGAMLYHEFANPYSTKLKMNGMRGTFTLSDDNRRNDYVVLRSDFSYDMDNISVYGNLLSYVDSKARSKIDLGFKYNF